MADPNDRALKQLRKQLDDLEDVVGNFFGPRAAGQAGKIVVREMKRSISKGISPIASIGRYAPYASQRKTAAAKSSIRDLSKSARGLSRRERAAAQRFVKSKRKSLKSQQNRLYPLSVQKKFPSKRERPVNLKLGGDFLNDLQVQSVQRERNNYTATVGFKEGWELVLGGLDGYELGELDGWEGLVLGELDG